MNQIPLMFIGDSPDLKGGLSRIGRDVATVASRIPELKVGYMGMGGSGSTRLGYMQYNFPEIHRWGENYFWKCWEDLSRGVSGVVMTIWDASRTLWLTQSRDEEFIGRLKEHRNFQIWGYFPVDGHNRVTGNVNMYTHASLLGYDRVLAYGMYGANVLEHTLGRGVPWIPHGVNLSTFKPCERKDPEVFRVGVVMTNQLRKDWGLACEIVRILKARHGKFKAWFNVGILELHWDIPQMCSDMGIDDVVEVDTSVELSDGEMAEKYSQCDVT